MIGQTSKENPFNYFNEKRDQAMTSEDQYKACKI